MNTFIADVAAFSASHTLVIWLLAFASAAAEAIVVVGAVVPGTAMLLALSALAGAAGHSGLAGPIIVATTLGAIAGDGFGYWLGRRFGRGLFERWPLSRHPEWLARGEAYFARHGGKSVFLGRFVPGVKTVVPAIAGISRMAPAPFLAANAASAILWSLALVLGGLGIGRSLDRSGLADPRILLILIVLAGGIAVTYWVLRAIVLRGAPALNGLRVLAMQRLEGRAGRLPRFASRLLSNDGGAAVAVTWAALSAAALVGFLAVAGQVVFDAGFSKADAVISNAVQALRFQPFDAVMIAVTMAGDGVVVGSVSVAVVAWLALWRQWRAAAATTAAFVVTALFVPALKATLGRQRPNALYEGADAFSFPSGHATHAMVLFGVIAILLAHSLPARSRIAVYLTAVLGAVLIAFSRIYLGAHWPSDVGAGLLFGSAVITGFAFVLRDRVLALRPGAMAAALGLVFALAYGVHVDRSYAVWTQNYAYASHPVEFSEAAWRNGGWKSLARQRITLAEEPAQPFVAQYAGQLDALLKSLATRGWTVDQASTMQRVLSSLLPYGDPQQAPSSILLHDGRLPTATLTRPSDTPGRRLVLRVWPADAVIAGSGAAASRQVYLLDLSTEIHRPVALGFSDLDQAAPSPAEVQSWRAQMGPIAVAAPRDGDPLLLGAGAF